MPAAITFALHNRLIGEPPGSGVERATQNVDDAAPVETGYAAVGLIPYPVCLDRDVVDCAAQGGRILGMSYPLPDRALFSTAAFLDGPQRFIEMHVNPATLGGALIYLALFVIFAWSMTRMLSRVMQLWLARDAQHLLDPTAVRFLLGLGRIFIWIVALVFYAHLIPALRAMGTALLTGVSVVSIVIGLAAQNTLGNLVAGLGLLLYRPFRVGDRLQVSAPTGVETGTVESLSLGYTVLATFDNRRIVLPNSAVANQVIVNLSAVDPRVIAVVPVSIGYSADIDKARSILLELAAAHPAASEPYACPVVNLGASSVDLSLRMWCADASAALKLNVEILEMVKKRFDAAGVEMPYAYTNVILHREDAGSTG